MWGTVRAARVRPCPGPRRQEMGPQAQGLLPEIAVWEEGLAPHISTSGWDRSQSVGSVNAFREGDILLNTVERDSEII